MHMIFNKATEEKVTAARVEGHKIGFQEGLLQGAGTAGPSIKLESPLRNKKRKRNLRGKSSPEDVKKANTPASELQSQLGDVPVTIGAPVAIATPVTIPAPARQLTDPFGQLQVVPGANSQPIWQQPPSHPQLPSQIYSSSRVRIHVLFVYSICPENYYFLTFDTYRLQLSLLQAAIVSRSTQALLVPLITGNVKWTIPKM